jgi:hypothetical protein
MLAEGQSGITFTTHWPANIAQYKPVALTVTKVKEKS